MVKEEREHSPCPLVPTAAGKASPGQKESQFLIQEGRETGAAVQRGFSPSRKDQEMEKHTDISNTNRQNPAEASLPLLPGM